MNSTYRFFSTDDTARIWTVVPAATAEREGYLLAEGDFLLECWNGYRTIATPTGRTRKVFAGVAPCPTFTRFEVATIADEAGVIWGAKADRIPGTVAVRAEALDA